MGVTVSGWKYEPGVIFDHVEFNTKIVMAISTGLVSLLLSRKSNFLEISSCTETVRRDDEVEEEAIKMVQLPNPEPDNESIGHVSEELNEETAAVEILDD